MTTEQVGGRVHEELTNEQLNDAVATRVMGWTWVEDDPGRSTDTLWLDGDDEHTYWRGFGYMWDDAGIPCFDPAVNLDMAMLAARKLRMEGWGFELMVEPGRAGTGKQEEPNVSAQFTAPAADGLVYVWDYGKGNDAEADAVSRAALKAADYDANREPPG